MSLTTGIGVAPTAVILTGRQDWDKWYEMLKTVAQGKEIWDYIDPEKTREKLLTLDPPVKPEVKDIDAAVGSLAELNAGNRELYRMLYQVYISEMQDFKRRQESVSMFRAHIQATIADSILSYTFNCETAYDMLVKLKDAFAPTALGREQEVLLRYKKSSPRASFDSRDSSSEDSSDSSAGDGDYKDDDDDEDDEYDDATGGGGEDSGFASTVTTRVTVRGRAGCPATTGNTTAASGRSAPVTGKRKRPAPVRRPLPSLPAAEPLGLSVDGVFRLAFSPAEAFSASAGRARAPCCSRCAKRLADEPDLVCQQRNRWQACARCARQHETCEPVSPLPPVPASHPGVVARLLTFSPGPLRPD